MCHSTMMNSAPLLVLALAAALAAPAAVYDDHIETMPQKRAALVLDRLLIALRKALSEGKPQGYERPDRDGPRTAPLRITEDEMNEMSSLERRGQTNPGRGRVLRCYFNAVTCF